MGHENSYTEGMRTADNHKERKDKPVKEAPLERSLSPIGNTLKVSTSFTGLNDQRKNVPMTSGNDPQTPKSPKRDSNLKIYVQDNKLSDKHSETLSHITGRAIKKSVVSCLKAS